MNKITPKEASFKPGDVVEIVEPPTESTKVGDIREVTLYSSDGFVNITGELPYSMPNEGRFAERCFKKLPLSNLLNKRLYPDREEYKGFLVPANFRAKQNEEKDQRE